MNRPEKTFKAGAVEAAVWNNETDKGAFKSVQLSRSYKGGDGSWKTTGSLRATDIPKARLVLDKAFEYLTMESAEAS